MHSGTKYQFRDPLRRAMLHAYGLELIVYHRMTLSGWQELLSSDCNDASMHGRSRSYDGISHS